MALPEMEKTTGYTKCQMTSHEDRFKLITGLNLLDSWLWSEIVDEGCLRLKELTKIDWAPAVSKQDMPDAFYLRIIKYKVVDNDNCFDSIFKTIKMDLEL